MFENITAITSIIAIIISLITLYKSYKQEFEIAKGNIVIYFDYDLISSKVFLIIKNTGNSVATIKHIECNKNIESIIPNNINSLISYNDTFLAPNQKIYQEINFKAIKNSTIIFNCQYVTLGKSIETKQSINTSFISSLGQSSPYFTDNLSLNKCLNKINNSILLIAQRLM